MQWPGRMVKAIPGKVDTGFPSGIAENKQLEPFIDSVKR